ncbi:MAG: TIGR00730 family Rossman fold protein [Myxococcales bacterium]|nr:TIGR00730 family Rossman fold protein [Myxococcales bacterium]MCB9643607.1 TIGR00730 family Rossman fold protein [Myxococcales bacterium]
MGRQFGKICVFCGSREGARESYVQKARRLGQLLAEQGAGLVYGGGSIGLMGTIADAVLASGGHVVGVIPETLARREIMHSQAQEMLVVDTMHTRKAKMASLADAFIAMPGGYGTFEELFEIITWAQLGIHQKPIGLLNVDGYFDALLTFVDHAIAEGFVHKEHRNFIVSAEEPETLLEALASYKGAPSILKIMELDQT